MANIGILIFSATPFLHRYHGKTRPNSLKNAVFSQKTAKVSRIETLYLDLALQGPG